MNEADLARVLAAGARTGGTMSDERWIERMLTMAREMGVLSARVDANDRAVEAISARTEESIGRHTAHLRGELVRIERLIQTDRESFGRKIEESETKLQRAVETAIEASRTKQAIERNGELVAQNKELSAQLASHQRDNRLLIVISIAAIGGLAMGIEHAADIITFIRGLM